MFKDPKTFLITPSPATSSTTDDDGEERVKGEEELPSTPHLMEQIINDVQSGDDITLIFQEVLVTVECFVLLEALFPSVSSSVDELHFKRCTFEGSFEKPVDESIDTRGDVHFNRTWNSLDILSSMSFVGCTPNAASIVQVCQLSTIFTSILSHRAHTIKDICVD
jgi:hypothetical protein